MAGLDHWSPPRASAAKSLITQILGGYYCLFHLSRTFPGYRIKLVQVTGFVELSWGLSTILGIPLVGTSLLLYDVIVSAVLYGYVQALVMLDHLSWSVVTIVISSWLLPCIFGRIIFAGYVCVLIVSLINRFRRFVLDWCRPQEKNSK